MCSTMGRMTRTARGFKCEGKGDHFMRPGCGNEIDTSGVRIPGTPGPSPLMIEVQKAMMARPITLEQLMRR